MTPIGLMALMLYFSIVAHKAYADGFLEVYEDMVEVSLVMDIYFSQRIRRLKICSVVLLPALKPACSSALIFSACGFNLLSMIFKMTLLGWLMRLIVR